MIVKTKATFYGVAREDERLARVAAEVIAATRVKIDKPWRTGSIGHALARAELRRGKPAWDPRI